MPDTLLPGGAHSRSATSFCSIHTTSITRSRWSSTWKNIQGELGLFGVKLVKQCRDIDGVDVGEAFKNERTVALIQGLLESVAKFRRQFKFNKLFHLAPMRCVKKI